MTTSSLSSGKLSLRKRRREKLVGTKSKENHDQHKTEVIGKNCRRIPIPSFSPLDDQELILLQEMKHSHTLNDKSGENLQTVTKAKSSTLLGDDLHSMPKADDTKNTSLSNYLTTEDRDESKISGESGSLCDSQKVDITDIVGCQTAGINPISVATANCPLQSCFSDGSKPRICPRETAEEKSDDKALVSELAQLNSKDDASDSNLKDSTEKKFHKKTLVSELAQFYSKGHVADNNLKDSNGSMTDETEINDDNQKKLRKSMTKQSGQKETTRVAHNKQKPLYNYYCSKSTAVDLVDSPSLRDFNVPRSKYLADKEATLIKKHAYNLERSKNGASKKKSSNGIYTKGSSRNSQRKQCSLCLTCSCARGSALQSLEDGAISENQNPLLGLARSDAEIERALIGRLARLEKSASWFDNLCSKVDRDLKRHRNKMKARMKENDHGDKPKFLSDVDTVDERRLYSNALPKSVVNQAKLKTFSFRKKAQPTLTQMLADSEEPDGVEMDKASLSEIIDVDDEKDPTCDENNDEQGSIRYKDYVEARSRGKEGGLWNASREKLMNMKNFNTFDESICTYEKDLELDSKDEDYSMRALDYGQDGLSELLDVFDVCDSDHDIMHHMTKTLYSPSENFQHEKVDQATYSQLSPISKSKYNTLKSRVDASPEKVAILKSVCPDWEENIRFALGQTPTDVREALISVRKRRDFLSRAIDMLQKQSVVLDVYEMALNESLHRHESQDDRNEIDVMSYQS